MTREYKIEGRPKTIYRVVKIAVNAGIRKWHYVLGILKNWKENGHIEAREDKKGKQESNYAQADYEAARRVVRRIKERQAKS